VYIDQLKITMVKAKTPMMSGDSAKGIAFKSREFCYLAYKIHWAGQLNLPACNERVHTRSFPRGCFFARSVGEVSCKNVTEGKIWKSFSVEDFQSCLSHASLE
jgi:hypothetical protein